MTLQKYVSAENGGGMNVTVDRDIPSSWETFRVRCLTNLLMLMMCCSNFILFLQLLILLSDELSRKLKLLGNGHNIVYQFINTSNLSCKWRCKHFYIERNRMQMGEHNANGGNNRET